MTGTGLGQVKLPVPRDTRLIGVEFYTQAVTQDEENRLHMTNALGHWVGR